MLCLRAQGKRKLPSMNNVSRLPVHSSSNGFFTSIFFSILTMENIVCTAGLPVLPTCVPSALGATSQYAL